MSAILKTTTSVGAKSPAQLYIISLYRKMLRASKTKDPSISTAVKAEFRANRAIPRKELLKVEFFVRKAEKNLKLIQSAQVKGVSSPH